MDPLTLALIFGGGTALNEMTTGQDKRKRDAILKANAYRMHAYDKSINPESYDVYTPDPMGKGIQSGIGGYSLASQVNKDKSIENFLNAQGSKDGGIGSRMADYKNSEAAQYFNEDSPLASQEHSVLQQPGFESPWSIAQKQRRGNPYQKEWNLGTEFTW